MTDMQDPNIENTVPTRPNHEIEETVPTTVQRDSAPRPAGIEETQPSQVPAPKAKVSRPHRWPWILLGLFLVIAFGVAGVWLGYGSAAQIRAQKLEESRVSKASEHFMTGLVAQQNKQYEIARIQFEHVIQLDPSFPGAQDKLREVMIEMAMDMTPTPAPTIVIPTLTPTLDTRPQEDIYNQARQLYAAKDWDNLFATIDALRRVDTKYKAVEIDGMLYVAYRFRGIDKIIHTANLEGGLYDLALAERFAPLDVDSLGYQNWARMYLNGASFWQIDWLKVMQYFEQIYPYFPNMRDASGITAIERYRIAARSQGDKLNTAGDYCNAYDYYKKSLQAVPDQAVEKKAAEVFLLCHPPTNTPANTSTVAPTINVPTVENTVAPTQAQPTQAPTVAPSVAPTAEPTSG
jgi:tetratricopeptide (TPR) repeat protein